MPVGTAMGKLKYIITEVEPLDAVKHLAEDRLTLRVGGYECFYF